MSVIAKAIAARQSEIFGQASRSPTALVVIAIGLNVKKPTKILESFIGGHTFTGDEGRFIVNGIVPDAVFTIYAETEDGRQSEALTLEAAPGIPIENVFLRMN